MGVGAQASIYTPEDNISEATRKSYSRASGLWPREPSGIPMPWSESPTRIKLMIASAYKTELGRLKITLKETVESDLQKYAYLSICFVFFCFQYFNAFITVTPSIRRLSNERCSLHALIKRGREVKPQALLMARTWSEVYGFHFREDSTPPQEQWFDPRLIQSAPIE